MSRKQQLYLEILERILPFMRNIQTHSSWRRFTYGSFFPEMELVHNMHRLLVKPEITEHDVNWLNYQARIFYERGDNPIHAFHEPITDCIRELFSLVPEPLRAELIWKGPKKVPIPKSFAEIAEIIFIANDATGPFSRDIQWTHTDGEVVDIEGEGAVGDFIRWLSQENPECAATLNTLFNDADERNIEVCVYRRSDH
jgi:hypothetical protein